MQYKKFPERKFTHLAAMPFIYIMIVPLFILDLFLEAYHQTCFRLYGIPMIERSNYIKIDRHKLSYLDIADKINCAYCGYANGLARYAVQIAAKTEEYWCGIKHKKEYGFIEPIHHENFLEYGDEQAYRKVSEPDLADYDLKQAK